MKSEFNTSRKLTFTPIDPTDGGGGGGTGGTITLNDQNVLSNIYFDMTDPDAWYGYIGQIVTTSTFQWYFNYYMNKTGGVDLGGGVKIAPNGDTLGNDDTTLTGTGATTFGIHRKIGTTPGFFSDTWGIGGSFKTNQYLILQTAVAIAFFNLYDTSGFPLIGQTLGLNSITSIGIGVPFAISNGFSRGKDVSSGWTILKTAIDGSYTNVPAVVGVDYELLTGNLTTTKMKLQFISSNNFTIKLNVAGYTFANNPYLNYPTNTWSNNNSGTYFFNTASSTVDVNIKFPKVSVLPTISSDLLLGTTPFETYQNQLITITPTLDLTGAYWHQFPVSSPSTITDLTTTKTLSDWEAEMISVLNIVLEVRNKLTNELILTRNGLDPYTILLQQPNTYTLQIKTSLK